MDNRVVNCSAVKDLGFKVRFLDSRSAVKASGFKVSGFSIQVGDG